MQIAEAFVAIRPKSNPGEFKREVDQQLATTVAPARAAGAKAGQQFGQGFAQTSRQTATANASRIALDLASAFGTVRVARGLQGAIQASSNLSEQVTKNTVVFGQAKDAVLDFAEGASQSIGQSERAALEATGTYGALFRSFGIGDKAAADMSIRLTTLASDIASFSNRPIEDAATAIRSGLVGEQEPLRLFGVTLNEVRLKGEALALGLTEGNKPLSAAAKAQAAYSLILKDTSQAQGDYQRTADGLANTQRRVAAEQEDAAADLGKNFEPIYKRLVTITGQLAKEFGGLPGPVQTGTVALVGLAVASPILLRVRDAAVQLRTALFGIEEGGRAAGRGLAVAKFAGQAAAIAGVLLLLKQGVDQIGKTDIDGTRITKALDIFTESGRIAGVVAEEFGADLDEIGGKIERALTRMSGIGDVVVDPFSTRGRTEIERSKKEIEALDEAAANLDASAAQSFFDRLKAAAISQGRSVEEVERAFPSLTAAIRDNKAAVDATAPAVKTLGDRYSELVDKLTGATSRLDLDDSIDGVKEALGDLNEVRLDAEGRGEKSQAAAEAEADAYESLRDAQRGAADSSRSLADAQRGLADAHKELASFDSPTEQTIRALERTQITSRVVETPDDVRQKTLDLLKFDRDTAEERADLQRGVIDAQRQVADAERGVADATRKVAEAQVAVGEASQRRRDIQVEAAGQVEAAERKAEQAVLDAAAALAEFALEAKPGDEILQGYIDKLTALALLLDPTGTLANNLRDFNTATASPITSGQHDPFAASDPNSPALKAGSISKEQAAEILKLFGIQVKHQGGIVQGAPGSDQLILAQAGEEVRTRAQQDAPAAAKVEQTNHFYGGAPTGADLDWANYQLARSIARRGRRA